MSAHTPGPWVVKFRNDHSCLISLGDPTKGPHKQFDLAFDDLDPSDVADARLIAAAPDLLGALLRAKRHLSVYSEEFDMAERAIAKATGEQA